MTKKPTALTAAESELEPTTITVAWRDLTFTVPPLRLWPVDVYEALEDDRYIEATRALLGPEQWAAFKASTPRPTMEDFNTFSEMLANGGPALGESEASSDS
jgi:hypothetical protein